MLVQQTQGVPEKLCLVLCDYCGGDVDSIISAVTKLHRSGFNLEFEALFDSACHLVADLWQRKGKK